MWNMYVELTIELTDHKLHGAIECPHAVILFYLLPQPVSFGKNGERQVKNMTASKVCTMYVCMYVQQ